MVCRGRFSSPTADYRQTGRADKSAVAAINRALRLLATSLRGRPAPLQYFSQDETNLFNAHKAKPFVESMGMRVVTL